MPDIAFRLKCGGLSAVGDGGRESIGKKGESGGAGEGDTSTSSSAMRRWIRG